MPRTFASTRSMIPITTILFLRWSGRLPAADDVSVLAAVRGVKLFAWAGLLMLAGCSGRPARLDPPRVDADQVARVLMEHYDSNGDGSIASDELKRCPCLNGSITSYDADANGNLSLSEIRDRIDEIYSSRIAYFPLFAKVTLDGRPLANAQVLLSPEHALEGVLHEAKGVSGANGYAVLSIAEANMPAELQGVMKGVQAGLYRVQVKHDSKALPDDVVSGERLGVEITPADSDGGIDLAIQSR